MKIKVGKDLLESDLLNWKNLMNIVAWLQRNSNLPVYWDNKGTWTEYHPAKRYTFNYESAVWCLDDGVLVPAKIIKFLGKDQEIEVKTEGGTTLSLFERDLYPLPEIYNLVTIRPASFPEFFPTAQNASDKAPDKPVAVSQPSSQQTTDGESLARIELAQITKKYNAVVKENELLRKQIADLQAKRYSLLEVD